MEATGRTRYKTPEEVISGIQSQKTLVQIARNNTDPSIRTAAMRRVTNVRVLMGIVRSDSDPMVRRMAETRAKRLEELRNEPE